jgi:hypothetical protein
MRLAACARGLVLVVVCAALTGCNSNNKGKIEGTHWSSIAQSSKSGPLPAGAITLDFNTDMTMKMSIIGGTVYSGKYSLGFGNNVTFNFDQALEGRKSHVETIKINGDELQMIDSDGTTVTFKKVNAAGNSTPVGLPGMK